MTKGTLIASMNNALLEIIKTMTEPSIFALAVYFGTVDTMDLPTIISATTMISHLGPSLDFVPQVYSSWFDAKK